ncbi:MAG: gamma-glutamyltransferase [Planctomycetaceae bacterium]|nr:gamma-glutamyltransferase [Planctomycetaceae bacterium]
MAREGEPTLTKHAVVAQEAHAAEVGRTVLRAGGNAIDAAVATAFALAVTVPEAGNLGGGGFLVAYLADRREIVTVDFRETAPRSASPRMYLGSDDKPRPRHRAGAWAAGVPGTVRGLGLAHARWGKLAWANLVQPAARLAREGFPISADLAGSLNSQLGEQKNTKTGRQDDRARLADFTESVSAFARPDGAAWKAGDRFIQSDLAATLERIAAAGPDEFYTGRTAQLIARYMEEKDGRITADDLAAYQARLRPPVHTTFRGCAVWSMGPPSSGGVVHSQMLNILERFDLKADGAQAPRTVHRITEAMRRAFFTRAESLGDPDFVAVATNELVSKAAAGKLAHSIGDRATPSASLAPFAVLPAESDHTTHFSTIDAAGNAVALTYTLEDSYGAKAVVAGAGFLLNNEMGDFNLIPGRTDTSGRIGTPANIIAPGKRMLSSMTPTIVLRNGKVRIVTGSPGGRTIPNTTLWVILGVLEFGLDPRAAVDAPRTHHQWFPDVLLLEGESWTETVRAELAAMGHHWRSTDRLGIANTIVVDPSTGQIHGIADRRRSTTKAAGD